MQYYRLLSAVILASAISIVVAPMIMIMIMSMPAVAPVRPASTKQQRS